MLTIAFFIGYSASADFLPGFGIVIYPTGYIFTALFIALTAYVFKTYRFIDLRKRNERLSVKAKRERGLCSGFCCRSPKPVDFSGGHYL